jgi:hypothetical protein
MAIAISSAAGVQSRARRQQMMRLRTAVDEIEDPEFAFITHKKTDFFLLV